MQNWSRPRPLSADDDVSSFNSGSPELNLWLQKFGFANHRSGMSTVFVTTSATQPDRIVGFYALSTGGVEPAAMPSRVIKGIPRHEVPVIILARLAIDQSAQGQGLGRALLVDAFMRVARLTDHVGIRALLVHAKDQDARAFYLSIAEFEPSPTDPLHLVLLLKDLKRALSPPSP